MEFRSLKRQYEALKPAIDSAMLQTAAMADFISGEAVAELENRLAEYVGRAHCIACANGTDALELVLSAWKIGEGDAVFVPDFTFFATAEAVRSVGATPIFVDVRADTFNMCAESLEAAINKVQAQNKLRAKAIITVDLFGLPAYYPVLEEMAKKHGLLLLEDAAQGFGGTLNGKKACSFGDAATTSFFPAKPLGCYGDGGAIFTDDDEFAALVRSLIVHGKGSHKYDNIRIGRNSRLDTLQARILLVKFEAFCRYELADSNIVAANYTEQLSGIVALPVVPAEHTSSWAQYTLRLESRQQRDGLAKALEQQGIPSMVYYPKTMRQQTAFSDILSLQPHACPVAAELVQTVLSLPFHPYLSQQEISKVCVAVKGYLQQGQ